MYCKNTSVSDKYLLNRSDQVKDQTAEQIRQIRTIAINNKLDNLDEFDIAKYGRRNFENFINAVEKQISKTIAEIIKDLILIKQTDEMNGKDAWEEIYERLCTFNEIVEICQNNALTRKQKSNNLYRIFYALDRMNGHNHGETKYNIIVRTFSGFLKSIAERPGEWADCAPLSLGYYFTAQALGLDTKLYAAQIWDNKRGYVGHVFGMAEGMSIENTSKKRNEKAEKYNVREINPDELIAERLSFGIEELMDSEINGEPRQGVTTEDILHRVNIAKEFLPYAQNNVALNTNLAWGYKRLAVDYIQGKIAEQNVSLYEYLQNSMWHRAKETEALLNIYKELANMTVFIDKHLRIREILKEINRCYRDLKESNNFWRQHQQPEMTDIEVILQECGNLFPN